MLIRYTCPGGRGSDDSGPKWHDPPCSRSTTLTKSFRPQRRGLLRSLTGDPEEESPIPEQLRETPFARKPLPEQGFGFRKANALGCCVFAGHFPSDER
jgi:hypothetical protein